MVPHDILGVKGASKESPVRGLSTVVLAVMAPGVPGCAICTEPLLLVMPKPPPTATKVFPFAGMVTVVEPAALPPEL